MFTIAVITIGQSPRPDITSDLRKLLPEGEVTQLARYLDINADAKIMLLREELDVLEQKTEQAIETYVEQKYL